MFGDNRDCNTCDISLLCVTNHIRELNRLVCPTCGALRSIILRLVENLEELVWLWDREEIGSPAAADTETAVSVVFRGEVNMPRIPCLNEQMARTRRGICWCCPSCEEEKRRAEEAKNASTAATLMAIGKGLAL